MLALPYALFMLFDRQARRAFATPGPWLALATALLVAAPHVVWLFRTDFLPFAYASHRAAPVRGWFDHFLHPAMFTASQFFFALPSLFIAAALFWPRGRNSAVTDAGSATTADTFDRRIVTLLAFGPGLTMIAFAAVSGRGTIAMWGYPLWLYLGLWLVLAAPGALDAERLKRIVAAWAVVFAIFAAVFVANYSVLPYFDHRYRAVFFPGDKLGELLTQRFRAATASPLRYVIGTMWDGGNLAHYSPDQPQVLIDGLPDRAPWIDLNDLRKKGAVVVWTVGDTDHLPAPFAAIAANAEIGAPFDLPMRRGTGEVHVGWAILKPH
jgi:hypothetical protein